MKTVLPADVDKECVALCKALNKLPGIHTEESCCGHGKEPFGIWFRADCLAALPNACYWFAPCHCGLDTWDVIARTDCGKSPAFFYIRGPVGEQAYKDAKEIARLINRNSDDYGHKINQFADPREPDKPMPGAPS